MRKLYILFVLNILIVNTSVADLLNFDGPNCINNVLVESELINYKRYSSLSEIKILLSSPLCKQLSNTENLDNTIGLVHTESKFSDPSIIAHAFMRINSTYAQEKHGYSKTDPYQVVTLKSIYEDYDLKNPEKSIEYFRCTELNNYIEDANISIVFRKELKEIEIIERELHQILETIDYEISTAKQNSEKINNLENKIKIFSKKMALIISAKNNFQQTASNDLVIKILASRVVSIAGQLNAIGFRSLRERTSRWEFTEKNITDVFAAVGN